MKHFWHKLPKPFLALAPMEDVTDTVFRRVIGWCGAPDVYFTEFTSTDGLCSAGREKVIHRLQYTDSETPLVAQIWGKNPEHYLTTAKLLVEMGFQGIDINLGCPVQKIVKNGCCSALIDNPSLVKELYLATKEGAGDIPVSIKTRLGFKKKVTEEWSEFLLNLEPAVLTMHGRTAKQMSKVPANWDEIGKVVNIRDQMGVDTLVVGNGDIRSRAEALAMVEKHKVDGVMIGRGVFHDPYIFNQDPSTPAWEDRPARERLELMLRHIELHLATWENYKPYPVLKKFFKIYVSNFSRASDLRVALMDTTCIEEAQTLITAFLEELENPELSQAVGQ